MTAGSTLNRIDLPIYSAAADLCGDPVPVERFSEQPTETGLPLCFGVWLGSNYALPPNSARKLAADLLGAADEVDSLTTAIWRGA